MDSPFGTRTELDQLTAYLQSLKSLPIEHPRAVLVISAHWEEKVPTVMSSTAPPLLFDYYNFPPHTYELKWAAKGSPDIAKRVRALLEGAGFQTAEDTERGYDHGTFVPLMLTYPDGEVPIVQLSLKVGLDPAEHLAMGRALAPLRDEGVFIVGSGMSYHNMRGMGASGRLPAETFDAWLQETASLEPNARDQRLSEWTSAPSARGAHPREEHLLPLMVVAGAAGEDRGKTSFAGTLMNLKISGFTFG